MHQLPSVIDGGLLVGTVHSLAPLAGLECVEVGSGGCRKPSGKEKQVLAGNQANVH